MNMVFEIIYFTSKGMYKNKEPSWADVAIGETSQTVTTQLKKGIKKKVNFIVYEIKVEENS